MALLPNFYYSIKENIKTENFVMRSLWLRVRPTLNGVEMVWFLSSKTLMLRPFTMLSNGGLVYGPRPGRKRLHIQQLAWQEILSLYASFSLNLFAFSEFWWY